MKVFCIALAALFLTACKGTRHAASSTLPSHLVTDGKIWSSLFQQRAAEYKALCIQAYNIARLRLDESLTNRETKPRAIVTDIDETFLDNSPYAVHRALQGNDYDSPSWAGWTAKGEADTLTGALSFFNYAASRGVEVFYVTNRKEAERTGTMQNLRRYNFPFADDKHLVMRTDVSSKENRRQTIASTYDIVLLLGDNLADFSSLFDSGTTQQRSDRVGTMADQFGKRFIILPNANYGGWEDAIYGNRYDLKPTQKDSAIRANLKGY